MNTYQACVRLNIWHIVKPRIEIWDVSGRSNNKSFAELKKCARKSFHSLAMGYHPDRGGNHDSYLEISSAFDVIKNITADNLIKSLKEEKESLIQYYPAGSEECKKCTRWSDVVNMCLTVTCSGFKIPNRSLKFANVKNKFAAALKTKSAV